MKSLRPRRNVWGTLFLVFAATGFVIVTFVPWGDFGALRFVRAFFEASLVGALADWFAVTALFKKPMGLPLPHTNVLVRRKDQLVEALPRFFASFLEPEKIHPLLNRIDWAALVLEKVDPRSLDALTEEGWRSWLAEENPDHRAWEQQALGWAADMLHRELSRHRESLVGPATELIKRNAGWKGLFVSRETVDEVVAGFLDELAALRDAPEHPLRRSLTAAFHQALPRIAEQFKPSRWTTGLWQRLDSDPSFRQSFNLRVSQAVTGIWDRSGAAQALTQGLGYLLCQTDAKDLAKRIESAVGNDLQFIRVNGALVGGLAGLLLEALRTWT